MNKKIMLLFLLVIGIIFIAGCVEKTKVKELCENELGYKTKKEDYTGLITLTQESYEKLKENNYDLKQIQDLNCIEKLNLGYPQITDITPLKNLPNLKELNLTLTQVKDITPLQNLTKLEYLYLTLTQVKDITALQNLTNLKELKLSGIQIKDITPLENLTNLKELDLSNTNVSQEQINELKKALPKTRIIYLKTLK